MEIQWIREECQIVINIIAITNPEIVSFFVDTIFIRPEIDHRKNFVIAEFVMEK